VHPLSIRGSLSENSVTPEPIGTGCDHSVFLSNEIHIVGKRGCPLMVMNTSLSKFFTKTSKKHLNADTLSAVRDSNSWIGQQGESVSRLVLSIACLDHVADSCFLVRIPRKRWSWFSNGFSTRSGQCPELSLMNRPNRIFPACAYFFFRRWWFVIRDEMRSSRWEVNSVRYPLVRDRRALPVMLC
jgi:hypothetical protein